ncbi:MAG: ATP-binding protein [Elusimicrobia bacterium]|nr:ATP-binding protein [Elusimicrobiota bacterium]
MIFKRSLCLTPLRRSAFLFGPRMTGKTFLLRELPADLIIDLLDPELELQLRQSPRLFWEQVSALKDKALVVIDEVQRVPVLLDYVQKGIEEKQLTFVLSGSSARKLKRGGANLLGGRAKDLRLHPLTKEEMREHFDIQEACQFGTLPKVAQCLASRDKNEARSLLRSYVTTYIKEEIQAEALTRNVGAFQRFLQVAIQANAQVIEFANISRECSVPSSTVKEYYSILEDTLLGDFLWPWDRSERKKARPKFYFFDCGVVRAIQNRLNDPPTPAEMGFLFETWFAREIRRLRDYGDKAHEFSFWREGNHEIDLLIMGGRGPLLAIECKTGQKPVSAQTLRTFRTRFPKVPLVVASLHDHAPRRLQTGIELLPWAKVLERYQAL